MPENSPTLYLIDGHAQMFRSYFAIRSPMTSPVTGEPTNATYAFTGMMLKLFRQCAPDYVLMIIDAPGKSFRDELYPEYKANRDPAPEPFKQQVPRMMEVTEAFGVPVLSIPGAEADDIIATVTRRVLDNPELADMKIRIVSKDKDLEQLLHDRVSMFDIHTDTMMDVQGLHEKKGIRPDQVIDVLTLIGDNVDNIPGVTGIGPKTATALLQTYGTLDNLLEHLDEIKGKRRESLEAAREQFPLVQQLVRLKDDVDFEMPPFEQIRTGAFEVEKLQSLFQTMGFNKHQVELKQMLEKYGVTSPAQAPAPKPAANRIDDEPIGLFASIGNTESDQSVQVSADIVNGEYEAITTHKQLDALVSTLAKQPAYAFDTETMGMGWRTGLCGISLSWEAGKAVYIPVRSPDADNHLDEATVIAALKPIFEKQGAVVIGHNLKYDYLVMRAAGVKLAGPFFDTMIAAFLLQQPGLKLDDLALSMLGKQMVPITALIGERKTRSRKNESQASIANVPLSRVTNYASEDADMTWQLYEQFLPRLETQNMKSLVQDIEMPLVRVLAEMERTGIQLDRAILSEQRKVLEEQIVILRDGILEAAGKPFNPDSPKQLAEVLFTDFKLPVVKKTRTGASTDVEVLEKLAEDESLEPNARALAQQTLEYRQLTKLVGTYLKALDSAVLPETGRVHASFHQTGAATGRLSSSNPNLQNIPIRSELGRRIRKAFVAKEGHKLVAADYSQIELRVLAHLSEDAALIEAFEQDMDIHRAVAAEVFGVEPGNVTDEQRGHAKVINFGIVYGVTPFGLARRIEALDVEGATKLINDYRKRFTGIDRFLDKCIEQANEYGYVTTITGRRRNIMELNARGGQNRQLAQRLAINSVVQGSAADLIKLAMVQLYDRIAQTSSPMRLLLQIHDELVVETPASEVEASAALLKDVMESAMPLRVPLKVDAGIGDDWFDVK